MENTISEPARMPDGTDYALLLSQAVHEDRAWFRCDYNAEGLYTLNLYFKEDAGCELETNIEVGIATEFSVDDDQKITHVHITDGTVHEEIKKTIRLDTVVSKISRLGIGELKLSIAMLFDKHNQRVVNNDPTLHDTKIYSIARDL